MADESLDRLIDPDLMPIVQSQRDRMGSRPPLHAVTPAMMRERAAAEFEAYNADPLPLHAVRDFTISHNGREVPVRLYEPEAGLTGPILVHFHGGGWTIGSPQLEDASTRQLARDARLRILSVDYRLSPEHPFPAPLEDGEAVMGWLRAQAEQMAVDPDRIAICGASAGANVALGTVLRLRDTGQPLPARVVLLYGAYLGHCDTPSHRAFGDGAFGLTSAAMDYFWLNYTGVDNDQRHPHAVPIKADLSGLPPVFLNHSGLDVLADDTIQLAQAMRDAGLDVTHHAYAGAIHGFTQYVKISALARDAMRTTADWLAGQLATG